VLMTKLARRAIGRIVEAERRTTGLSELIPPRVRYELRQAIGMAPLGEGRRYAPGPGLERLFETLNERNTAYVVLRWFEDLPDRPDGDIDFLAADEALPEFNTLLGFEKSGFPCDVYSESGRRGFRYAGMPYFPPLLARGLLSRRIVNAAGVSVPCPEDHFLSLAYHAVYQKGLQSGLPTSVPNLQPDPAPKHDYRRTLARLAERIHVPVEVSMEALDEVLSSAGWRPAAPVLKRLARYNVWIRRYFGADLDPKLQSRLVPKPQGEQKSGGQRASA
jgi:hypothetical protein